MKILTIVTSTSGGAGRAAFRIHQGLIKYHINSQMLVLSSDKNDKTISKVSNFKHSQNKFLSKIFYFIKRNIIEYFDKIQWNKYPKKESVFLSDLRKSHIGNLLSKINFDILHIHWVSEGYINFKELRKINKPIVWTIHDCYPFTGICHYFETCDKYLTFCHKCQILHSTRKKDLSYKVFNQKKARYKYLDLHIVSPSQWLSNIVQESFLLRNRPINVIPNTIDIELFYPISKKIAKKAMMLQTNKKYILFGAISSLNDKRKGFSFIKQIIPMLINNNIELLVFGNNGEEIIDSKIKVTYLGNIDNDNYLRLVYSAADLLVVPSMYENLPNTIMESLSCETPVVAFNIGGNKDMVDHKKNGFLATPYDVDNLYEGIEWCLSNNQGNLLGKNGRIKIMRFSSEEVIIPQYIDVYSAVHRG